MAEPSITQTTPYDSADTLVCQCERYRQNSNGVTRNGGQNRGGGRFKSATFNQYLLYLSNGARYNIATMEG